jgi:chemotaxis signal transduction protein
VGGIAIVFDAAREFSAMLRDVLDGRPGVAAFVDDAGLVVASTSPGHQVGQPFGADLSKPVIEYQGANFALAATPAVGYREFKCNDGYQNHIRAVVALRLGALERRRASMFDQSLRALPHGTHRQVREFALFQVGASRYALPVTAVLEARSQQGLVRTARLSPHVVGLMEVGQGRTAAVVPVLCGRSLFGMAYPARSDDGTVLVMADPHEPSRALFGFRVDDVISVLDIDEPHIHAAPAGMRHHAPWLAAMVRLVSSGEKTQEVLAQLMDADALVRLVRPSHQCAAAASLGATFEGA